MKILVISNLYPPHFIGGYELICRGIVDYLIQKGHSVEVLTSDYRSGCYPELKAPVISRSLRIHGMYGNPWLPIWRLRSLEMRNNGILRAKLRSLRPDIVYCWGFSGLSKSLLFTLRRLGVPTAFAVFDHWIARAAKSDVWLRWWNHPGTHGWALTGLRVFGARALISQVAPTENPEELSFPRIHFCSRFLRDFTARAGWNVRHGAVIYCPVDTARFRAAVKSVRTPMRRLLFVGRLHPDKGVMTAVRAMGCLRDQYEGTLTICGRGEENYEERLRQAAVEANARITFADATPEKMPGIYAGHDALVFPSEWPEPFALTPLEAMSCGLPVIGTPVGGSVELFRHRENAMVWTPGDASDLSARILELDKDSDLRVRIASAGQREVTERFSAPGVYKRMELFLEDTMETWKRS